MFLYKHFIGGSETKEIDDIVRNLTFVLKTKRGCGYFIQTFGLSDVGYRTPAEMVTALSDELEENIRQFEPRVELAGIDEEHDDDGRRVRLVVSLRLRNADEKLKLVLDLKNNTFEIVPEGRAAASGREEP